ncbi:MAG: hypothetical protein AAF357_14005 [Verrucomicrobiota bacterium]
MIRLRPPILILTVALSIFSFFGFAAEPRKLLVTKFVLEKLEQADLTEDQLDAYGTLCHDLRLKVHSLREEVGISKEVIDARDKSHRELKGLSLSEEGYWKRLQAEADLSDEQVAAFQMTGELYAKFKVDANGLLTDEQKKRLRASGRSSLPDDSNLSKESG